MGSSVSIHKNPDSIMKFQFSMGSSDEINNNNKKLLITSSINNNHPVNNEEVNMDFNSHSSIPPPPPPLSSFQTFGSKEESFFDSQAWLESDCDDDFLSVNGDLTPSRNSASDNQSNSFGTKNQFHKSLFVNGTKELRDEPSTGTDKKKRLSELLQESFDASNGTTNFERTNLDNLHPKTPKRSQYMFGLNYLCSSENSPSRHSKTEKEKSTTSAQCCIPSYLMTSRSFNERKKRLSPERSGLV